jgi:hypothetical protein
VIDFWAIGQALDPGIAEWGESMAVDFSPLVRFENSITLKKGTVRRQRKVGKCD